MKEYKYLAFDIDGTLTDSLMTGIGSMQCTIRDLTGVEMDFDFLEREYYGLPSTVLPGILNYPDHDAFMAYWEDKYQQMRHLTTPWPGIVRTMADLKAAGYRIGLVTSRRRIEYDCDPLMEQFEPFIDAVITMECSERHKPDAGPMLAFIRKMSEVLGVEVKKDECLYLGDTWADAGCAHNAGCDFALADYRSRGAGDITPEYIYTCDSELRSLLRLDV